MSDVSNRINGMVATFVAEITRLARIAAVSTLADALTDGPHDSRARVAAPRARRKGTATRTTASVRAKGAKRPQAEIAEIRERAHKHIKANPGQRIEQINKVLGTRTADLSLPLKHLVAEGAVATKGARRATRYYPGRSTAARSSKRHRTS